MGLLDGLLGNASKIDPARVQDDYSRILAASERVEHAFQLIRDIFVFTNLRLVLVNKQGLSGNKVEYLSIPYSRISRFSIEAAGTFDLNADLKVWMVDSGDPVILQFNKKLDIYEVQAVLAAYVLR
ncbi:MAG: PH domain-containing protein [Gemmatimonadales bacterium]|nr:PH domain-containing protein [Gemmatimonadales bacterium]